MIRRYVKISIGITSWLVLNAIFNAFSTKLPGLGDAILFIVLCHLCWIGMIAAIPGIFRNRSRIFYWSAGLAYLLFLITYLIQVPSINLYLSNLGGMTASLIEYLYNYSSQLRSTMVMLAGNITVCLLVILIAFSGARTSIKDSSAGDKNRGNRSIIALRIVGFLMAVYLSWAALTRHNTFHSKAWDLAIFAQLIDNFRHGVFFEANVRGLSNIFADHFTPIIYIFSPLLYIWNDPSRLLLVVQAIFITLGAIPVYLIAKLKTGSQTAGVAFGIAYLLLPTLQFMNLFDFHPVVLSIPIILAAWYAWELRRYGWMYFFVILSMLCQEEVWIIVGAMGLFLALFERERKHGVILTIVGWGGFIAMVLWFFPMFRSGEGYFYFHRYAYLGNSFGEIARNMVTHPLLWIPRLISPRAIMFVILMLIPVGFLPLWRPKYLLILLPTYIYSALSVEELQTTMFAQYAAPYVPFIMIGAIYGVVAFGKTKPSMEITSLAVVCVALASNIFFSPLPHGYAYQEEQISKDRNFKAIEAIINTIPLNESISIDSKFAPHLVRRNLFLFPDYEKADYIVIDLSDNHDQISQDEMIGLLSQPGWQIQYRESNAVILKRGNSNLSLSDSAHILLNPLEGKPNSSFFYSLTYPLPYPTTWKESHPENSLPIYVDNIYYEETGIDAKIKGNNRAKFYSHIIKKYENTQPYMGVFIYPNEKGGEYIYDGLRLRRKTDFEVINLKNLDLIDQKWKSIDYEIHQPKYILYICDSTHKMLFLLIPTPFGFQNTLDEYFNEMVIRKQLNIDDLDNPSLPVNSFLQTIEFWIPHELV